MASRVVLVTGASRGIGLGLVRELLRVGGYQVLATCRDPTKAKELQEVLASASQPAPLPLDVSNDESVTKLAQLLQEKGIAVTDLINNAGISTPDHPKETVGSISRSQMMDVFNTNVAGVAAITSASGVLKSSNGKVINISSGMGSLSITKATSTYSPSYRCSKAAVNMLTVCFAKDFPGTSFATVHPGWVQTDMGGSGGRTADIGVEESARGIVQVLLGLENSKSGQFVNWKGEELPW